MGRIRNAKEPHRPGPLKQTNKKHKGGQKKSLKNKAIGPLKVVAKIAKGGISRLQRRKQSNSNKKQKFQEIVSKKKNIGGFRGASIQIGIVPLSPDLNSFELLDEIFANSKNQIQALDQYNNFSHLKLSNGKNLSFCISPVNDFWATLDSLKLCDITLLLLPNLQPLSPETETLLRAIKDQGISTPILAVNSNFNKKEEKSFIKANFKNWSTIEKIYSLTRPEQVMQLLRTFSGTKLSVPRQNQLRSALLIEDMNMVSSIDNRLDFLKELEQDNSTTDLVEVCGIVRRKNLNPYQLVHITGSGNFQIMRIDVTPTASNRRESLEMNDGISEEITIPPRFIYDPIKAAAYMEETEAVIVENDNNDLSGDEMSLDDEDFEECDDEDEMGLTGAGENNKKSKKLPKGTSDYQSKWLDNSDEEYEDANSDIIGSDDEFESEEGNYDDDDQEDMEDEMDWNEEIKQRKLDKETRDELEFPDWIDTPMDRPAKERFQRYRGLQSFKKSPWDPNENLPKEYSRIYQFQNFRHTYKNILKEDFDGYGYIPIGQRVTIILRPVNFETFAPNLDLMGRRPICLFSLLKNENKTSVINLQLNVSDMVKNKETLYFQVGFHRFQAKPILSEISSGNKHKMIRIAPENSSCIATVFCPIIFPNASVLVFRHTKDTLESVGSGSLYSIEPSRVIIKRIILSGFPYKVHGKSSVIRFMFFNRDDIDWFKPIELKTRYGRRGHIKEPLGTHGYMKCKFDGQIKSQDTILMCLYKRVFPKWNYDENVPSFSIYEERKNYIKPSALKLGF